MKTTNAAAAKPMTFKSERAAKMAYTKAKKAQRAKETEGHIARDTYGEVFARCGEMDTAQYEALRATEERCAAEAAELYEAMRVIYTAATAQEFWLDSWEFGENATRDLIRANCD